MPTIWHQLDHRINWKLILPQQAIRLHSICHLQLTTLTMLWMNLKTSNSQIFHQGDLVELEATAFSPYYYHQDKVVFVEQDLQSVSLILSMMMTWWKVSMNSKQSANLWQISFNSLNYLRLHLKAWCSFKKTIVRSICCIAWILKQNINKIHS